MQVEIATLCDAATDQQGKLNILGTFDALYATVFPVVHPHCAIAYRLRFQHNEQGEHGFSVKIIDARGSTVVPPIEGKIQVQSAGQESSTLNIVLRLNNLEIQQPGGYSVVLVVDGREQSALPLFVRRSPEQAVTAQTA